MRTALLLALALVNSSLGRPEAALAAATELGADRGAGAPDSPAPAARDTPAARAPSGDEAEAPGESPMPPEASGPAAVAANAEPPAEPTGYRMDNFRAPVPLTLRGASVLSVAGARAAKAAGTVFIDVYPHAPKPTNLPAGTLWRDPVHESIVGAVWLPNVGYGALAPEASAYLEHNLASLSGGDMGKPMVFFCLRNCWMSWNTAKRAIELGYTRVLWFPEGTDGWKDAGLPVAAAVPVP